MPKKKKQDFPVREPNADDAIELLGILAAAGVEERVGQALGLVFLAMQSSEEEGAQNVLVRSATEAITSGLSTALRDPSARQDARAFIYSLWSPKLSVDEGETFDAKKQAEWKKLPMRAPMEIIESFRQTDNFADFLDFFTSLMPTAKSSGDSSTPSSEGTASDEAAS